MHEFLDKLERKFGSHAIQHLTLIIIVGQVIIYLFAQSGNFDISRIILNSNAIKQGEWWRSFSFIFFPTTGGNIIFALFYWYMFWFFGKGLEEKWGLFKSNIFLLCGYFFLVALSFLDPAGVYFAWHIMPMITIAFAIIYPEFELNLYGVLPVKSKWFGILSALFIATNLFSGHSEGIFPSVATILCIIMFFGEDLLHNIKTRQRRAKFKRDMKQ